MDFWGVAVGAAIASAAWIYQRAWEHQEKRVLRYQNILDRLSAFTMGQLDPSRMDEALVECRRLWLSAPDNVVRATEEFLDAVEGKISCRGEIAPDSDEKLGACIVAMRRDATFSAAVFPRFWRTGLKADSFRLKSARKPSEQPSVILQMSDPKPDTPAPPAPAPPERPQPQEPPQIPPAPPAQVPTPIPDTTPSRPPAEVPSPGPAQPPTA